MSRNRGRSNKHGQDTPPEAAPLAQPAGNNPSSAPVILPRGRLPAVGVRELVAALQRRRERRRETAAGLSQALQHLTASVEQHLTRVTQLRAVIEAQGGDLSHLRHYDTLMARLRAELRSAERALADAFSSAAQV